MNLVNMGLQALCYERDRRYDASTDYPSQGGYHRLDEFFAAAAPASPPTLAVPSTSRAAAVRSNGMGRGVRPRRRAGCGHCGSGALPDDTGPLPFSLSPRMPIANTIEPMTYMRVS